MSDPIDGAGGPGAPEWTEAAEGAEGAEGFEAALGAAGASAVGGGEVSLDDLDAVVVDVAQRLYSGQLTDPASAIEQVIEEAVSIRTGGLAPALQQRMAADLKAVLMGDPFFVLEIEALIAHTLDRLP